MELTAHYVTNWTEETFLPMQLAIKYFGVYNACWISRLIVYPFIFFMLLSKDKSWSLKLLFVITTLYWCSMAMWLFFLKILTWPKVYEL